MPGIVVHLKSKDVGRDLQSSHLRPLRFIRDLASEEGIEFKERIRDADIKISTRGIEDDRFNDGNLHILDDRTLKARNVLNAGIAYLDGFWHLDPNGTKAFSSIGKREYRPFGMPVERSQRFFETLQNHYVSNRKSRLGQTPKVEKFPSGALAVLFQGSYPQALGRE